MIDIVIAVLCIGFVGFVAGRGIWRMKKGESGSCGCGCKGCSSQCHSVEEKK
ncbi:FeoB-associated Cys-rich membrane protein [Clostridium sp. Marseille-P299]|uniref:FeoB-associated Cys-rich membrane protein n=1 Tax=Clostridium sp. Marseille-P299 TaxID=1805477 RepID=UPI0009ECEB66|nr:FeoB-associated Cys-rich membrane protein [Clostridium sp. Marseille-P299]